ncbi:Satratoxin biosynthesis SC3 cluster transcription factor SAT20 [Beauveria bassiana]|nr:Satratoxin biosynthesis SC3 cluster transcription factor SAT20 [Beauveria bassiana]
MDPPTSYIYVTGTEREADTLISTQQVAPPPATADHSLYHFGPDLPSWYAVPAHPIVETEPPSKRRRLHASAILAPSTSQITSYGQEVLPLASQISTLNCPVHGQDSWSFRQLALASLPLPMETHMHPFSRRVAELGRLVCSCTALVPLDSDGYERLNDSQPYNDANQEYSHQYVTSPHEINGQQPFGPEPIMNSSSSPEEHYSFSCEPFANPTIPISAFSIARAHTQPEPTNSQLTGLRPGKRGPFRDQNLRQDTAYTRKIGCCIRCRMQRIRCDKNPDDPDGTCLTCKRVNFAKTGQLPCLRYKIADIALYKSGQVPGFEWTRRWSNEVSDPIDTWASPEIKTIRISEGYSDSVVELQVRQFVPMEGDKLDRTWDYNGEKKSVRIPPFALIDTQKARKAFARHIDASVDDTLKNVIKTVEGTLGKWMRVTYLEAFRLAQRSDTPPEVSKILQSTFRLWTSTRLNTISCFIVGEETLGMPSDILDDTSPTPGKVPVPPVMGAQLNLLMIHEIQAKLRKTVLEQLQKIVQKNKHSTWLVTYFVNFILLHNASMIISHDAGYAKKHGIKVKPSDGANIILAYFHYCNKGLYPFSDECSDSELKSLAELNENDVKFVRCTANYARAREVAWRRLRESHDYDHPEYYISQMFEQNWKPRSMVV